MSALDQDLRARQRAEVAVSAMIFRQRCYPAWMLGSAGPFTLYDYMTGGLLGYDCAARTGRDCLSAWVRWEERDVTT